MERDRISLRIRNPKRPAAELCGAPRTCREGLPLPGRDAETTPPSR
jgi:hypothetical protein